VVHDAVVIGAGAAGLTCAHRLADRGRDIAVVTESVGGRIAYDAGERVNYGAYFVMANYRHAARLVRRHRRIDPLSATFHDADGRSFRTLSARTARRLPGLAVFAGHMARFWRHYEPYQRACEVTSQRHAMELEPYIGDLFTQSARRWVHAHRLDGVTADLVGKFAHACTGAGLDDLCALDLLNVAQGLLLPIHTFTFDAAAHAARLGDRLVLGEVVEVAGDDGVREVRCASGRTLAARNVVLATPAAVTAELLGVGPIRRPTSLYAWHVAGRLRPPYARTDLNVFEPGSPFVTIAGQDDGSHLVYTTAPDTALDPLFAEHTVIGSRAWPHALYVGGHAYLEQQYGERTYVAGDHNGLGLEPAAISGVWAANQILDKTRPAGS